MDPHAKWILLLPGVLLAAAPGCGPAPPPSAARPDVVIVLVDTLRADFLEPQGFERETTPALTLLAQESVLFEAAHSPAPWTLPSVVSILSGRHLAEHNVVTERTKLSTEIPTLGEILSGEGYRTASFHKNAFAGVKAGLTASVVMLIAGFFFCVVSGYLVGMIGSTNNPISGITLSTLIVAALLMVALGDSGQSGVIAELARPFRRRERRMEILCM